MPTPAQLTVTCTRAEALDRARDGVPHLRFVRDVGGGERHPRAQLARQLLAGRVRVDRGSSRRRRRPRAAGPSPRRAPRHHRSPGPRSPRCAWRRVIASAPREGQSRAASQAGQGREACTGRPRDVKVAAMHLDLRGHPLHTRSLSVTLTRRADGRLDVRGELVDLRKRGFVPVARRAAAVRHRPSHAARRHRRSGEPSPRRHRRTPAERRLRAVRDRRAARAAVIPWIASARSAGTRLDDAFARRLGDEIGGPRGCSHVLTLAHLLGSTVAWALERDGARRLPRIVRGERVFRRDVIVDGAEPPGGGVDLALQLIDLAARARAAGRPVDGSLRRVARGARVRRRRPRALHLRPASTSPSGDGTPPTSMRRGATATTSPPVSPDSRVGRGVSAALRERLGGRAGRPADPRRPPHARPRSHPGASPRSPTTGPRWRATRAGCSAWVASPTRAGCGGATARCRRRARRPTPPNVR